MPDMLRCDLQVHSRYSDRPSEWILRKLGVPESYTDPATIYQVMQQRGMNLVTITDHNRLEGCLEIADRPGVFLSEKVTTYFPEDHCKIHLLVWNLTEEQHRMILQLRRNIYELAAYLETETLAHGVAYPLRSINGLLTADHIEKCLLLFRCFDGVNCSTTELQQTVFKELVSHLDEKKIQELADRHQLEPKGAKPWEKVLFGGSDDHAGLFLGQAWTEVSDGSSARDFFRGLTSGRAQAQGGSGDVTRFSAGLYKIIFSYASDRLRHTAPNAAALMERVTERFLAGENPTHLSFSERVGHVVEAIRTGKALDLLKPNDLSLNRELTLYFLDGRVQGEIDEVIRSESSPERRSFRVSSKIANDLLYRLFQQILNQIQKENYLEALQPASGMIPIAGSISPYVFSYFSLYGSRRVWESVCHRMMGELPEPLKNEKRAWFTDTLEDVNGVARTIRTMGQAAQNSGHDLTIVTSRADSRLEDINLKNFPPVGEFELPEYKLQKLSFPPILDMIDYIEQQKFSECIISTPGPVGLTALAAAKLMGLRTTGIYHTDFPQYVRILTEDEVMETMMWNFMHWFYSQFDLVYVNSQFYKECWVERGIPAERIQILPRGLDTQLFHHSRQDRTFWQKRGLNHPVLLYVGRVSKEKELEFFCRVMETLQEQGQVFDVAVVGEGPFAREMKKRLPRACFTGVLQGEALATAYASADCFVFPSTTDTFGNVVIEAISSGIPAFVSDVGGPCELVEDGKNGRILPALRCEAWVGALTEYLSSPFSSEFRVKMAEDTQKRWDWSRAFGSFWEAGST